MSNHISNGKADTVNGADAVLDLDALAEAIRDDVRRGVACFRAAGEKLLRAKEECIRQGKPWLRWVKDNLPVTPRTASNWMRLAREVPDQDSPASETVSDTGLRRAIDRIAGKAKRRRAAPPAALPATVAGPSCTLHHGDAVKVMREMQDSSADFIFTDPPYGLGYQDGDRAAALKGYDGEEVRPILNDTRKAANLLFRRSVKQFARLLKPGGVCCVCAPDGGPTQVTAKWAIWLSRYLKVVTWVPWLKPANKPRNHYQSAHELVLVAYRPGAPMAWHCRSGAVENVIRDVPRVGSSWKDHPTEKPFYLAAHFIELHTRPGDLVLDPFCGSGVTGEAAEYLDRRFIGVEADPEHYAVAARRLGG